MRKVVFIFLLLLLIGRVYVHAQSNEYIDSLENELTKKLPDTTRVDLLLDLSVAYTFVDFKKAKQYALKALDIANESNNSTKKYKANQQIALNYSLGGDYTSALQYETIALQMAMALEDSTNIGLSHSNIGNYYFEAGVYDEAYYYLTRAYRILQQGDNSRADSLYMNIALHNVGRVFKELGQFETAIQHLKLSNKISKKINDREGLAYYFDEIGDIKLRQGDYDSALHYLTQAEAATKQLLAEEPENLVLELKPKTLTKIAQAYANLGEFEKAKSYYDSTYSIHEQTGNQFGIAEVNLGRGRVSLMQEDYDDAQEYIEHALSLAHQINARTLEINCYDQLSQLWEQKGDFKKALGYQRQYRALNDSLFSQEMQQKLFRDQVRFETEAKDNQIAALTKVEEMRRSEIRKQELIRNILVVLMALTAILLFTVFRSGRRRKRINMLLLQHQEEMETRREELEQLNKVKDKFFSIISHDLRSPINALAGVLDLLDRGAVKPEELPMALKELRIRFNHTRTLLNNLLDWTLLQMDKLNLQATKINLHGLVTENIGLLISLEGKRIDLINKVPQNASVFADNNTINLVIRNLLTNALKFTNDGGEIAISGHEENGEWVIAVRDNGVGMKPEIQRMLFDKINPYSTRGTANEKGTGLGLILCKEFVEKNNGRIWVESEEGKGSTFWFTLPKA